MEAFFLLTVVVCFSDAFCRGAVCWRSSFGLGAALQALAFVVGLVLACLSLDCCQMRIFQV